MPEPLSSKIGFGMNVAVLPAWRATFLITYLKSISLSAIAASESKRMSISAWPAVPTSWCWTSTGMPSASRAMVISDRRSW